MRTKLLLAAAILLIFVASFLARGHFPEPAEVPAPKPQDCRRIITMAPSITETLFELGLGDRVVGVTQFCNYPPQAARLPRVGGFLDPNFEAVVALKPDLIVMLVDSQQSQPAFRKLGLPSLVVCHKDVAGILESFLSIGRACGAEAKARQIMADIDGRISRIRRKTAGLPRPRVLFVIERSKGSGLRDVYVAGADGFFDKIIAMAGGENACRQSAARFPVVSVESILWMDPEVIIDMSTSVADRHEQQAMLADWQEFPRIEAVSTGRIHAMDQDYAFVPGPRFILLVEQLARLVHPEVAWE